MDIIYYSEGVWHHKDRILALAQKHNPAARVIHIDSDWDETKAEYGKLANTLSKYYRHESPNPPEMELTCFKKWCYVLEYVRKNGIAEFFVADWDLLIFCDISREMSRLFRRAHDIKWTHSNRINIGSSAWWGVSHLQAMVGAMIVYYRDNDPEIKGFVDAHMEELEQEGIKGGVCDMVFAKWLATLDDKHMDTCHTAMTGDMHFDNNIMETNTWGVSGKNGMKDVCFAPNGMAYLRLAGSANDYAQRAGWLHCSAAGKARIDEFLTKAGV